MPCMSRVLAFLNGRWISASEASVSVSDAGFVQGTTVAEQVRTFAGNLFRLDDHLARLAHSLEIVGIDPGMTLDEIGRIGQELVARNHPLLAPGDDLGLSIVITPGPYAAFASGDSRTRGTEEVAGEGSSEAEVTLPTTSSVPFHPPIVPSRATVCLHTYLLPFHLFARKYREGQALVTTDVEQIPAKCWPPPLKCRSRMHYYLADRRAAAADPRARALLLDAEGFVTEASTANVLIYRAGEGLISPRYASILHGISLAVAVELAGQLGIPFCQRDLTPNDVAAADEMFLMSTTTCILPVTRFNGRPIGDGKPGGVFLRLLAAWSEMVGVDIVGQAERMASLRSTTAE
jgi:branched-chain amino acid aminotransferase